MSPATPLLKKSLGQHFLINKSVAKRIVDLLEPASPDQILEIGPGGGSLTELLKAAPHTRLALIEKDDYWASLHAHNGLELFGTDAIKYNWSDLCACGEWKLIGNLPYNIASPLIWNIVATCQCYTRAVFMTQKEVAKRICAKPNSRDYGALSVWVQAHSDVALEIQVGPGSFRPPPKVDSAVILLTPKSGKPANPVYLASLLHLCFQQRRKQLVGIFRRANKPCLVQALSDLGIGGALRPENMHVSEFIALADLWAQERDCGIINH